MLFYTLSTEDRSCKKWITVDVSRRSGLRLDSQYHLAHFR